MRQGDVGSRGRSWEREQQKQHTEPGAAELLRVEPSPPLDVALTCSVRWDRVTRVRAEGPETSLRCCQPAPGVGAGARCAPAPGPTLGRGLLAAGRSLGQGCSPGQAARGAGASSWGRLETSKKERELLFLAA